MHRGVSLRTSIACAACRRHLVRRLSSSVATAQDTLPGLRPDASLIGAVRSSVASSSALPPAPPIAVYRDAVSEAEEASLVREAEVWLKKRSYEHGHFDGVIIGYREVQKQLRNFTPGSRRVLERLIGFAFPREKTVLPVHVLDLHEDGHIMKHVDHTEYSGEAIVGLSLLTDAVMTLHHEPRGYHDVPRPPPAAAAAAAAADRSDGASGRDAAGQALPSDEDAEAPWLPLQLPRRSLYILRGAARYEWAHAVSRHSKIAGDDGTEAARGRRLALIFRDAKEQ